MPFTRGALVALAVSAITLLVAPAAVAQSELGLDEYVVEGAADKIDEGVDGAELAGIRRVGLKTRASAVLTRAEAAKLAAGVPAVPTAH